MVFMVVMVVMVFMVVMVVMGLRCSGCDRGGMVAAAGMDGVGPIARRRLADFRKCST